MEYYFITGTSRGIGESLAKNLLERKDTFVFGISRSNTLGQDNFHFIPLDLSENEAVSRFEFPGCDGATKIVLVNNAGAVGEVGYAGQSDDSVYSYVLQLNLTSPCVLTNRFLAAFERKNIPLVILNISSGAAKNPIDGWSAYCASKAGLDMFSRVVAEELSISGKKHIRIFAVAPGVVDTAMQDQIRASDEKNFSRLKQFLEYKSARQLADPGLIAQKLLSILEAPEKYVDTVFSVKDLT